MQKFSCKIIEKTVFDENGNPVKIYGLSYYANGKRFEYDDLCTDRKLIVSLAEKLGNEQLDLRTLYEIFDDFIFQKQVVYIINKYLDIYDCMCYTCS